MNKSHEIDIGGVPAQNIQESLEGLRNTEVRNLNNEVQQPAPNGAEEINRLVAGVASAKSPTGSGDQLDANNKLIAGQENHWDLTRMVDFLEQTDEVPNFVSTRKELLQIVRYWVKELLELEFVHFRLQISGGVEMLFRAFVEKRIARIANLLGDDAVNQAKEEAFQEFGEDQDPREWNVFLKGSAEERRALQEEIERKMQEGHGQHQGAKASGAILKIEGGSTEVGTSQTPVETIASPWPGTGMPPDDADRGLENLVETDDEEEYLLQTRAEEEIARAAIELEEKVWYYRKLVMLEKIERGEEEMPPDDIADGMFAQMERMEEQYGENNPGPFNDWYWGYLNGKLSAIRWVLGRAWDDLDT